MAKSVLSTDQQQQILDLATINGDFIFASGLRAREKFEFDNIPDDSVEFELSVNALAHIIKNEFKNVYAIMTVANGAIRLGDPLAALLDVVHIPTARDNSPHRIFTLVQPIPSDVRTVVIVDDVYTRGTNATKVGNLLANTNVTIMGEAVICDRSRSSVPTFRVGDQDLPVYSAIKHHKPTNNE